MRIENDDKMTGFTLTLNSSHIEERYWLDVWFYRELLVVLAWRDILVQYKQALIGIGWAVLRPAIMMSIFVVVFGKFAKLPSDGIDYSIFALSAILPWALFSNSFSAASSSLIVNRSLITKVYFPKFILLIASLSVSCVDFILSLIFLFLLMMYLGYEPTFHLLLIPFLFLLTVLFSLGLSAFFAPLNAKYRDFQYIIPFLLQIGLFASPVAYSSNLVPETYRVLYALNPMVAMIDGFRWSVTGGMSTFHLGELLIAVVVIVILAFVGVRFFWREENSLADII